MTCTLDSILDHLPAPAVTGDVDPKTVVIASVTGDSRAVTRGALFVAIPGDRVDGHDFIAPAVAGGAVAIVGSRPVAAVPALHQGVAYVRVAYVWRGQRRVQSLSMAGGNAQGGEWRTTLGVRPASVDVIAADELYNACTVRVT